MNEIELKNYYSTLFGFYKNLFTIKQQEMFDEYYNLDYSLQEIADARSISRNAVWDTLKKVVKELDAYEASLHLYAKDVKLNEKLNALSAHTDAEGERIIKEILEEE